MSMLNLTKEQVKQIPRVDIMGVTLWLRSEIDKPATKKKK
jgi:hypothetical protein